MPGTLNLTLNLSNRIPNENFDYKQICYLRLRAANECMNITNSSNKGQNSFQIDFHDKLYFGEKYTFTIRTIACQNECNETSNPISNETGNKDHIFEHKYF
jgi:hypothetical protein